VLVITRRVGEKILIGEDISLLVLHRDYTQALASSKNRRTRSGGPLSLYNTGTDWRGLEYAERVLLGAPTKALTEALSSASATVASKASRAFSR